jgi:hypothetical protein
MSREYISFKVEREPSIQPYAAHKRVRKGFGFIACLRKISVKVIVEYSDVELASCHGNRRIRYFYVRL